MGRWVRLPQQIRFEQTFLAKHKVMQVQHSPYSAKEARLSEEKNEIGELSPYSERSYMFGKGMKSSVPFLNE